MFLNMKRILYLATAFAVMALSACCTKQDVFSDSDKDAIKPVSMFTTTQASSEFIVGIDEYVLPDIIAVCGLPKPVPFQPVPGGDAAAVVNSREVLERAFASYYGDAEYSVPEIDFDSYSLVVGYFCNGDSGAYAADQRLKKTANGMELYVKVAETGGYATPTDICFAGLYPKLPDQIIRVIRWEED